MHAGGPVCWLVGFLKAVTPLSNLTYPSAASYTSSAAIVGLIVVAGEPGMQA